MAAGGPTDLLGLLPSLHQAAAAVGAVAVGAVASGGASAVAARPQRPWDSWGLPGSRAGQGKKGGLLWEVRADLASLGVSLVAPTREMAYLHAGGISAELAGTSAHWVLEVELRSLQVRVGWTVER